MTRNQRFRAPPRDANERARFALAAALKALEESAAR